MHCWRRFLWLVGLCLPILGGCALLPEKLHQPQFHNPWPQLEKVAIAPFFNLSQEPTVNGDEFATAYVNELQQIPGFEVVPVGVTRRAMELSGIRGNSGAEFQQLARVMGVDAVVVGTVNDFTPYYPPRLAMTIRWYAANPGFHPIPAGYGLPWGRAEEEFIPGSLVKAAEFELAKEQLKTQTPIVPAAANAPDAIVAPANPQAATASAWPDPRGFIPPAPSPTPPVAEPFSGPILSQTRSYNGHDVALTEALSNYYEFRDEARFGGWQAYLQRSDDFVRFCCHMHITEMLAARGGADETKVVYRWPIGRYDP